MKSMTILELLNNQYKSNKSVEKGLGIIKENFTGLVNDNYELIINEKGVVNVKIPSLEKKDEYVYNNIGDYEYCLVMCMRINGHIGEEGYKYILAKFFELYKDKLELFFKDVYTVDKLMSKIKNTKNTIDYITYACIFGVIIGAIAICFFNGMSSTIRNLFLIGIIVLFGITLVEQFTKENSVKKVIDGYLSVIKTEWYRKELKKQYAFLCNFAG